MSKERKKHRRSDTKTPGVCLTVAPEVFVIVVWLLTQLS